MSNYVYILYAPFYDKYYKGYTTNIIERIKEHNEGYTRYTQQYRPWVLLYLEKYSTKREALIRERGLKKYSKRQILDLIETDHPKRVDINKEGDQ